MAEAVTRAPSPIVGVLRAAEEARRGSLLLAPSAGDGEEARDRLAPMFAAEGYDVLAPRAAEWAGADPLGRTLALRSLAGALRAPVFLLAFAEGADAALRAAALPGLFHGASLFYPNDQALGFEPPLAAPCILHLSRGALALDPDRLTDLEAAHPPLKIWIYGTPQGFAADGGAPDDTELALLRTRQHFHRLASPRESAA